MTKENEVIQFKDINNEIKTIFEDDSNKRFLLSKTFKGLKDEKIVRAALLEGFAKGYTLQDFIKRKIYAIPFGDSYALVVSIGECRAIGMKNGLAGISAPIFTYKDEANSIVETCEVTVKRKIGDYIGDYTSIVYLNEYTKGTDMWNKKPRTMICKVAEMHSLRKAFPEDLSNSFAEEEFDQEIINISDKESINDKIDQNKADGLKLKKEKTNEEEYADIMAKEEAEAEKQKLAKKPKMSAQ